MINIISVGLGGGLGAIFRYIISLIPIKASFPFLTFITNLVGAFLIWFISSAATKNSIFSGKSVLFWKTGFCGGFTTFSTFSLEAVFLIKNGKNMLSILYMASSVVICVFGVF